MRAFADLPEEQWTHLRRVGYWRSEREPDLPDPRCQIALDWAEDERSKVIEYLEASYQMPYVQAGPSWCRCGCPPLPFDIGTQDLTDGTWIFPEGLVHYVRSHRVKPDGEFLTHLRRAGFKVPAL